MTAAVDRVAAVAPALVLSIAEQELDETATHVGAPGIGRSHRRGGPLHGLIGVEQRAFRARRGFDRCRLMETGDQPRRAGKQRKRHSFEHRRSLYCFVTVSSGSAGSAPLHPAN
jgi:hypothetical protein